MASITLSAHPPMPLPCIPTHIHADTANVCVNTPVWMPHMCTRYPCELPHARTQTPMDCLDCHTHVRAHTPMRTSRTCLREARTPGMRLCASWMERHSPISLPTPPRCCHGHRDSVTVRRPQDSGLTSVMLATSLTNAMAFWGWNLQRPSCAGSKGHGMLVRDAWPPHADSGMTLTKQKVATGVRAWLWGHFHCLQ